MTPVAKTARAARRACTRQVHVLLISCLTIDVDTGVSSSSNRYLILLFAKQRENPPIPKSFWKGPNHCDHRIMRITRVTLNSIVVNVVNLFIDNN